MKIVVFATQHMQTGGIESHLQQFCIQMAKVDVQISLVILNSAMLPETEHLYRNVCHKVFLGHHGRSSKRLWWLVKTALSLSLTRFDALYTNGQGSSAGLFAKLVHFKNWVHHHHTAGDEADQLTWTENYKKTLVSAHHVIACANRNATDMAKALKRKIDVIPCFSRKVNLHEKKLIKPNERLRFGYFGRLIPEKGIGVICQMSKDPDLQHIEFHLWGEGNAYKPSFFEQYSNVVYNGTYNGLEGLENAINNLDAYLLITSHGEGLPIGLLEVMSAGLPWLSTDKGGISDIVCDPISTHVIPATSTYQQIKEEVIQLADQIRKGLINRNIQLDFYAAKFSSAALVQQWSDILKIAKN
jgi:glycosyltransferase involved in cell wall biosynthesis